MTNQTAVTILKNLEQSLDDYCELNDEGKEAFHMAITALELFGISEQLPSAQPEVLACGEGELIAQPERTGRWIPCSERLPEPRKAVLGYAPRYQNIYALYYDSAYGWMIWNPLRDDCFPNSQGEIVAWMPLPEAYRGEGD